MKLIKAIKCKLKPTKEERQVLKKTMENFADACNFILRISQNEKTTNRFELQKLCYKKVKKQFGLTANLVIRAISRVSRSAKRKPKKIRFFKATSVDYDQRIFSYNFHREQVSLSTIKNRLKIPLNLGNYQRCFLKDQNPTFAILTYEERKKEFYINMVLSQEVSRISEKLKPVGIDLGIKNIATCSNGLRFSGKKAQHIRKRYWKLRSSLQAKGTKSAKRTLIRLSGKEKRWMADLNHNVSRRIIESLKAGEYIVMEKLKGIRQRTKVRKNQRSYSQFLGFQAIPIVYCIQDTRERYSHCLYRPEEYFQTLFSLPENWETYEPSFFLFLWIQKPC